MGSGRRLALAATLAALLAVPAAAQAATIGIERTDCRHGFCLSELRYAAADGERNDVTVERTGGSYAAIEVVVRDAGAPLTPVAADGPAADCVALDAHAVRCRAEHGYLVLDVALGDGDDRLSGSGRRIDGGAGDDVLTGGDADDRIDGGGGRDVLSGGGGSDVIEDGDRSGAADADSLDGGDGHDLLSYSRRTRAVRVDLATGAAGERREGDRAVAFERVSGGLGDDDLRGDAGVNELYGAAGDDRLDGRGGRDTLGGGIGADRMRGGAGDDTLIANGHDRRGSDRTGDVLACGSGDDEAANVASADVALPGCELVDVAGDVDVRLRPLRHARDWVARLHSPIGAIPCARRGCVVMSLRTSAGVVVGRAVHHRRGRRPSLRFAGVRLSRRGATLLRRHGALAVRVAIAHRHGGMTRRAAFRTRLRAPR